MAPWPPPPRTPGSDAACSPTRTSAAPGRRRRRRCSPCGARSSSGATGIELDVHATADRHLVVCHDGTVDRTTNGHGPIHTLTLAELRALDNAYWFVPGGDETPGLGRRGLPVPGPGPRRPPTSAWPRWTRCSTCSTTIRRWRSTSTSSDGAGGRALRGAPGRACWPGTGNRSGHRGVVPRRRHRRVRQRTRPTSPPRRGRWPWPSSGGPCTRARSRRPCAHVALQVPAVHGDLVVVDERFVRRPTSGAGRARVDDQRRAGDGPAARPGRRRHHLGPAHHRWWRCWRTEALAYRLSRRPADELERPGSAPTGVGPLAVVGLLLAADLALDGPFRHGCHATADVPPAAVGRRARAPRGRRCVGSR